MSEIYGLEGLIDYLQNLEGEVVNSLNKGVEQAINRIKTEAGALTDNTQIRDPIAADISIDGEDICGNISVDDELAYSVEFGTGKPENQGLEGVNAKPFMYPAINNNREQVKQDIAQAVKQALTK